jgi:hypothetical protein
MDLINKRLSPSERASLLRYCGFSVRKDSGTVRVKNICYRDNNADLVINLETGLCNDFGNSYYSGDIIGLAQKALACSFQELIGFIKENVASDIDERDLTFYNYEPKNTEPIKEFWRKSKRKKIGRFQKGFTYEYYEKNKFIWEYDGISFDTLKRYGCGIWYNKFNSFSRSVNGEQNATALKYGYKYFFPYKSGIQVYSRKDDEKVVRSVYGSQTKGSFFGYEKDREKTDMLHIAKSPRECLNLSQIIPEKEYVVGNVGSENFGNDIGSGRLLQFDKMLDYKSDIIFINLYFDCNDREKNIDINIKNATMIKNWLASQRNMKAVVSIIDFYKYSNGFYKDFTDLVRPSMRRKYWTEDSFRLSTKENEIYNKAILNPIQIK